MSGFEQASPEAPTGGSPAADASHEAQAASFWRRWRARPRPPLQESPEEGVPDRVSMPRAMLRHRRAFSWVACEQRLFLLVLGSLVAASVMVWALALRLRHKEPLFVRATESLREAAAAYYNGADFAYDQLALFLAACLPLLHAVDEDGHPLLPLVQGLVSPEIYGESERRLLAAGKDISAHEMTQALTIEGITDIVTDRNTRRAAAYVRGYLTVTVQRTEAQIFPWRAEVLVEASPASRIDRYPFHLLRCEQRIGPQALAWDGSSHNGMPGE